MLPPKGAKPSKAGAPAAPLREHLEAVARQTGRRDPRLDEPDLPSGFEPTWCAFWTLFSGQALTFAEIDAWARLTGEELLPCEAEMLRTMSVVAVREASDG